MYKSIIYVVMVSFMLALVGCAGMSSKESSVCANVTPEESLICQKISNPEMVSSALLAANYAALKGHAYSKDGALRIIGELETIVEQGGVSYMFLITKASELLAADEAAAVLIILSPNINLLESPLKITPFDQNLLRAHLQYQRQLIQLAPTS